MAGPGAKTVRVGTSGWSYRHWRGVFYPEDLPQRRWLEHYAEHFDTVELNTTFYHLPKESTCEGWRQRVPEGFVFACKASRIITHRLRLADCREPLDTFLERLGRLADRLGPVLFQLPPSFGRDLARLSDFLSMLPPAVLSVFEFRDESWYCEETFELLESRGVCFCSHDMPGLRAPRRGTGPAAYVRFHGPSRRYTGSYSDEELAGWAEWMAGQWEAGRSLYAYFNNDVGGHAVANARTLRQVLRSLTGGTEGQRTG